MKVESAEIETVTTQQGVQLELTMEEAMKLKALCNRWVYSSRHSEAGKVDPWRADLWEKLDAAGVEAI